MNQDELEQIYRDELRPTYATFASRINTLLGEVSTAEGLRRKDHIIAALTERIPELEAPSNKHKRDGTVTESVREQQEKSEPETQKPTAVPWWKRMLAGTR
jgi:hypothetical protein